MSYVANRPEIYLNTSVGSGQCVALVQHAAGAPLTRAWMPGPVVKGATDLPRGTVIAVFDADGRYGNHTDHTSHAAIYLGQDERGIRVIDQWVGKHGRKPASERTLFWADRNPNPHPYASDNGDRFNVVE